MQNITGAYRRSQLVPQCLSITSSLVLVTILLLSATERTPVGRAVETDNIRESTKEATIDAYLDIYDHMGYSKLGQ